MFEADIALGTLQQIKDETLLLLETVGTLEVSIKTNKLYQRTHSRCFTRLNVELRENESWSWTDAATHQSRSSSPCHLILLKKYDYTVTNI